MEENKEVNDLKEKGMKKNHTPIIALIILVLVVALGFRGYYFYKKMQVSDPVKITTSKISELANESTKILNDSEFFQKGKTTNMTINGNIADYKFNIETGFDFKNDLVQILFNLSEKADNLLYLDGSVSKNNLFFQVAKNTNTYKLATDFSELFDSLADYTDLMNNDSSKKTTQYLTESIEENLTKDDFTKTKDKITLFDKEVDVTKFETTLDKKVLVKVFGSFIEKLAKDDKFLDSAIDSAKITGEEIDKADLKAALYEMKDELEEIIPETSIKYSIYVKGIDAVRFAFDIKDYNASIRFDSYKNQKSIYVDADTAKIALDYNEKTGEYSISMNKVTFVSGTYKEKVKKNDVENSLTFNIPLLGIDGEINTRVFVTNSLKEKAYSNALDITDPENASKLMEEIEDNDFITGMGEMLEGMFSSQTSWDSVDGIEF